MLLSHQFLWWLILISETFAKLCPSADIRNSVSQLSQLSGCRIIEGFLQLVLIDSAKESDYKNWTFPELREVTEYVIFYRVSGLKSVASLFPNLSVIRGEKLVQDYALILSEMYDLTDISLTSLTIFRGSVALNKNPRLGYAETVDWDEIAPSGFTPFIFNNSRSRFEDCDRCPTKRCWSADSCQMKKELFTPDGKTLCDKQCVKGCSGPSPMNCTSCRKFAMSVDNGTMCVGFCPNGTYSFIARYCISYNDCLDKNSPYHKGLVPKSSKGRSSSGLPLEGWFVWEGSCILECPAGREKSPDGKSCQTCKNGTCRKECKAALIETIADAQNLRECTFINGSLEIQIQDKNPIVVENELEVSLGKIEEIDGYLKIVRSSSITSLDFFKRLKFINGNSDIAIGSGTNYSFVVIDNQNLQDLFDWDTRPVGTSFRILKGRPFFHFNPRLCIKHINKMLDLAGVKNASEIEVAPDSNGGQFACSVFSLNVTVRQKYPTSIILAISRPKLSVIKQEHTTFKFMGYVVYYKPVESENETVSFEADSCSESSSKVDDVLNDTEEYGVDFSGPTQYHRITDLDANTLYAVFVKTYAVDSIGGASPVVYVQTLPSRPEMPRDFKAHANSSSEVILRWERPARTNGVIENYVVYGFIRGDDPNLIYERNYCDFSLDPVVTTTPPPRLVTQVVPQRECSCREEGRKRQDQLEEDICVATDPNLPKIPAAFNMKNCEKYIYKVIERYETGGKDLGASMSFVEGGKSKREVHFLDEEVMAGRNLYVDGTLMTFARTVNVSPDEKSVEMTVTDLKHYSLYTITLASCRARHPEEPKSSMHRCSRKAILSVRTLPDPYADNINGKIDVKVNNRTVLLKWTPPVANGLTVAYHVEMTQTDRATGHADCVPASEAQGGSLTLRDLNDGRYRLRLRSISLAGLGVYSDFFVFDICEDCAQKAVLVYSMVIFIVLVIIITMCVLYRYKKSLIIDRVLIASVNPEYTGLPQIDSELELPPENVKIVRELKRGNFGVVCEAILSPEGKTVAVKKALDTLSNRDIEEFLNEAMVMKQFTGCAHIVQLLGVVSRSVPQLVVMEMMAKGDLKTCLRESRLTGPASPSQMLLMAAQVADGMAYLESSKFVHRDLAARNCMVSADNVVKIGDFGMTRDVYETDYYRKGNRGLLPVRWMAPESLNDGIFTTKSDVWSYGVVLWEIATLASQPYQGMSNEQVLQYVITGNRLELPIAYPKRFKALTEWCWKWRPKSRPSFFEILAELEEYTTASFRNSAYYYTKAGVEARSGLLNGGGGGGGESKRDRRPTGDDCTLSPETECATYINMKAKAAVS